MTRVFLILLSLCVGILAACANTPTPTPVPTPVSANSTALVIADGIVEPIRAADLAFQIPGRVAAVNVNVGDQVKKGDVLAKLDDTAVQKQIAQAESAVALAQKQLDQLQTGATTAERTAAQAALEAAQKNYDKVRAGPTADDLLKARADNAQARRDQAQAAYDRIGGASNPFIAMTPESAQLQQAINNYNAADAAYREATAHPTAAELAAAQALLDQAKSAVARLEPTKDALDVARLQVQNAQAALAVVQANAAEYTLTAPYDGIIGQRNIAVGDVVVPGSPTPAFTLGDVSKLRLATTNLAEVDAPKVRLGESAQVTLDAFPGKAFQGKVAQIAPSAVEYRGDRVFTVWIDLDDGIANGLRWGMSATAKIRAE
jgi:multidrug efflux pump subunit AcrA (membrane-fusion protein)